MREKWARRPETGPEQAKMETEGGVTSVGKHSSALDLDSAQRGCGRDCSQPDTHILWEQLAWAGLRTLGNMGRECQKAPGAQPETGEWSSKRDWLQLESQPSIEPLFYPRSFRPHRQST